MCFSEKIWANWLLDLQLAIGFLNQLKETNCIIAYLHGVKGYKELCY